MVLNDESCYRALTARDSRFDGLFFVGVSSTGIYCRSVCSARTPKRENCTFYSDPALAERAGFRPCLLCRPESAPGRSRVDAVHRLATQAVRRIEDGALDEMDLASLASEFGVSDRHLRRAVTERFGFSPVELAQTHRLLEAKQMLADTDLPVGEIALASGFSSLRRFNALFRERYRLSPTDLRKRRTTARPDVIECLLGFRPPYEWGAMLGFLSKRTLSGVESVTDGVYRRTAQIGGHRGWFSVARHATRDALVVSVSSGLVPVLPRVLRRVRAVFDTASEPEAVSTVLGDLAARHPGLRIPGAFDGFELAVRAILGQQVTVQGARVAATRLAREFGSEIETPYPELTHVFPSAETFAALTDEEVASRGVIKARARAILDVAGSGIKLVPGSDPEATMAKLTAIKGIGDWTAQYIAMRALGYPDAFPASDLAVMKSLGVSDPKEARLRSDAWRPWRAYAVMHLWKALEEKP